MSRPLPALVILETDAVIAADPLARRRIGAEPLSGVPLSTPISLIQRTYNDPARDKETNDDSRLHGQIMQSVVHV